MNNHAEDQARVQCESIAEMVAALECDYDRLEELREARSDWNLSDGSKGPWCEGNPDDAAELADLESGAEGCESEDEARERIMEDPLEITVRSDWQAMGETLKPAEFCILLCTGGPAVRIVGDLDRGEEPSRPRVEYQDWGTPWTEYFPTPEQRDALQAYCACFYFGE